MAPSDPWLVGSGGWLIARGMVSRLQHHGAFAWLSAARRDGPLRVPRERESELLDRLWKLPEARSIDWPEALRLKEWRAEPLPLLRVNRGSSGRPDLAALRASLCFRYDDEIVEYTSPAAAIPRIPARMLVQRDGRKEEEHRVFLAGLGLTRASPEAARAGGRPGADLLVPPDALPGIVRRLTACGWEVEAEGKLHRPRKRFHLTISSGIDWFDMEVDADFGGRPAPLPRLLRAIERGKDYVLLDNGTGGILPETWLGEYRLLLSMGRLVRGRLRFRRSQLVLLDRLVSAQSKADVSWDPDFEAARAALAGLERVRPAKPEGDFRGELRPYQKEGLAWLRFLGRAGLGGCLADDMGLGKTVQVLALLEGRRSRGRRAASVRPSPSSPAPWSSTGSPRLAGSRRGSACSSTSGPGSGRSGGRTSATLRPGADDLRHAACAMRSSLKDLEFDYVVLDEAQAIKNRSSTYAKAARLLRAPHRLALTGTPIENHLGELWSLFEFLDPGLLGGAARFERPLGDGEGGEAARHLSRAPAPPHPPPDQARGGAGAPRRVEQTVLCELEPAPAPRLRGPPRALPLEDPAETWTSPGRASGSSRPSSASARPRATRGSSTRAARGSRARSSMPSSTASSEIDAEGNKALVFTQFTTLLGIVKAGSTRGGSCTSTSTAGPATARRGCERFQDGPRLPPLPHQPEGGRGRAST